MELAKWPKDVVATAKVIFLAHRNEKKWFRHGTSTLRWLVLATIAVFGGCAGLTPPSDNLGGGINFDYLDIMLSRFRNILKIPILQRDFKVKLKIISSCFSYF